MPTNKDAREKILLQDYLPSPYLIAKTHLCFELDAKKTKVKATLFVESSDSATPPPLILHGEKIKLQSLTVNKQPLSPSDYEVNAEQLLIKNPPPGRFQLDITNTFDPSANTALDGIFISNHHFCSQCEPEGFRKITYFLDRPDIMSKYRVTLYANKEKYPHLLSNGNCIDEGYDQATGQHWKVWEDPFPKPSYLFALVAGKFSTLTRDFMTSSGKSVTCTIFSELDQATELSEHAMGSLHRAMKWDEEKYGLEYDLDHYNIVAIRDFNMGAMENKSLNIFNSSLVLAHPEQSTDMDFIQIEGIVGHEYFHNWTGNRVTLRDWFQLCLKEGLTVFRDQEFSQDMGLASVKRINDVIFLLSKQFTEDDSPIAHPPRPAEYEEINNFYTATVYHKGAEIMRMLSLLLGWDIFRQGMDQYFAKYDGKAVTLEDFITVMETVSGRNLEQFSQWFTKKRTPEVSISTRFEQNKETYTLTFSQSIKEKTDQDDSPRLIPIAMSLIDTEEGEEIDLVCDELPHINGKECILELSKKEQSFTFRNIKTKPIASCFRNFSAPINKKVDFSQQELCFLWKHETDPFNRWQASQLLLTQILKEIISRNDFSNYTLDPLVIETFAHILSNHEQQDDALTAKTITLPPKSVFIMEFSVIPVDEVTQAYDLFTRTIGQTLQDLLLSTYEKLRNSTTDEINPSAVARRLLKNTCFHYLCAHPNAQALQLMSEQFYHSRNMTDIQTVLDEVNHIDDPLREQLFSAFYRKWEKNPTLIDRWFQIQARSHRPGKLSEIKNLLEHKDFSFHNPNRFRALMGSFSRDNLMHFHNAQGMGYQFCVDQILKIDQLNPQMSSLLTKSFQNWRLFDSSRQELMRKQLQRITEHSNDLSKDLQEIANKLLI